MYRGLSIRINVDGFFLITQKLTETTAVFLIVTFSQVPCHKTKKMTYLRENIVKTNKITFNVYDKTLKSTKSLKVIHKATVESLVTTGTHHESKDGWMDGWMDGWID